MEFQRVNRTQAEQAFGVCENRQGATISLGFPVAFTTTASSNNGYEVVTPAAANFATFAGVADADIADAGVGRYQPYGYRDSVRIYASGTSVTIAAGVEMGTNAGSDGVGSLGSIHLNFGPLVSMEVIGAIVCSPGGWGKAWIRLM